MVIEISFPPLLAAGLAMTVMASLVIALVFTVVGGLRGAFSMKQDEAGALATGLDFRGQAIRGLGKARSTQTLVNRDRRS